MSTIIKPNSENQDFDDSHPSIFLAGSIEMGNSHDWQSDVVQYLTDFPINIFNPRRDNWDSSWEQRSSNPQFSYQVNWEMDHLESADIIFMYFSPDTKSPISLLELGLHADDDIIVCCPESFWRRGNVEILCKRKGIPLFDNLEDAIDAVKGRLYQLIKV